MVKKHRLDRQSHILKHLQTPKTQKHIENLKKAVATVENSLSNVYKQALRDSLQKNGKYKINEDDSPHLTNLKVLFNVVPRIIKILKATDENKTVAGKALGVVPKLPGLISELKKLSANQDLVIIENFFIESFEDLNKGLTHLLQTLEGRFKLPKGLLQEKLDVIEIAKNKINEKFEAKEEHEKQSSDTNSQLPFLAPQYQEPQIQQPEVNGDEQLSVDPAARVILQLHSLIIEHGDAEFKQKMGEPVNGWYLHYEKDEQGVESSKALLNAFRRLASIYDVIKNDTHLVDEDLISAPLKNSSLGGGLRQVNMILAEFTAIGEELKHFKLGDNPKDIEKNLRAIFGEGVEQFSDLLVVFALRMDLFSADMGLIKNELLDKLKPLYDVFIPFANMHGDAQFKNWSDMHQFLDKARKMNIELNKSDIARFQDTINAGKDPRLNQLTKLKNTDFAQWPVELLTSIAKNLNHNIQVTEDTKLTSLVAIAKTLNVDLKGSYEAVNLEGTVLSELDSKGKFKVESPSKISAWKWNENRKQQKAVKQQQKSNAKVTEKDRTALLEALITELSPNVSRFQGIIHHLEMTNKVLEEYRQDNRRQYEDIKLPEIPVQKQQEELPKQTPKQLIRSAILEYIKAIFLVIARFFAYPFKKLSQKIRVAKARRSGVQAEEVNSENNGVNSKALLSVMLDNNGTKQSEVSQPQVFANQNEYPSFVGQRTFNNFEQANNSQLFDSKPYPESYSNVDYPTIWQQQVPLSVPSSVLVAENGSSFQNS